MVLPQDPQRLPQEGEVPAARWGELKQWRKPAQTGDAPPIADLDQDDRYRFLGWALTGLDRPDAGRSYRSGLARWLVHKVGLDSQAKVAACLDLIADGAGPIGDRQRRGWRGTSPMKSRCSDDDR